MENRAAAGGPRPAGRPTGRAPCAPSLFPGEVERDPGGLRGALGSPDAAIGLPARLAALLVSNVAGVVAAIVLYELARTDGREKAAFRAALPAM